MRCTSASIACRAGDTGITLLDAPNDVPFDDPVDEPFDTFASGFATNVTTEVSGRTASDRRDPAGVVGVVRRETDM